MSATRRGKESANHVEADVELEGVPLLIPPAVVEVRASPMPQLSSSPVYVTALSTARQHGTACPMPSHAVCVIMPMSVSLCAGKTVLAVASGGLVCGAPVGRPVPLRRARPVTPATAPTAPVAAAHAPCCQVVAV